MHLKFKSSSPIPKESEFVHRCPSNRERKALGAGVFSLPSWQMPGLVALWNVEVGWRGGEVGEPLSKASRSQRTFKLDFRCYLQMRLCMEPLSIVFEVLIH